MHIHKREKTNWSRRYKYSSSAACLVCCMYVCLFTCLFVDCVCVCVCVYVSEMMSMYSSVK